MRVVRLVEYKNRELVDVLKGLLALAEDGTAQGLAFVVKLGRRDHRAGLVGDYRRNPQEALLAAVKLTDRLTNEPETDQDSDFGESTL